jgi:hypothetical protein
VTTTGGFVFCFAGGLDCCTTSTVWLSGVCCGGTTHVRKNGIYVSGGRVASIEIEYKRYGVGVLFC